MIKFYCPECKKEVETINKLGGIKIRISIPRFDMNGNLIIPNLIYVFETPRGICKECAEKVANNMELLEGIKNKDVLLSEIVKKALRLKSIRRL